MQSSTGRARTSTARHASTSRTTRVGPGPHVSSRWRSSSRGPGTRGSCGSRPPVGRLSTSPRRRGARASQGSSGGPGAASVSARFKLVRARVLIRPKEGILDPQGKAIERALPALGFGAVSGVRVGRMVELEAEEGTDLESLCERLLANPLIEDYEVEEVPDRGAGPGPSASGAETG